MNRIASLLAIDGARFRLRARTFSLLFVSLAGWVLIIGSLGLLAPVAGFLQVRYILKNSSARRASRRSARPSPRVPVRARAWATRSTSTWA
jgi:uncharacterized membrane protein YjgN (DUF898 family)